MFILYRQLKRGIGRFFHWFHVYLNNSIQAARLRILAGAIIAASPAWLQLAESLLAESSWLRIPGSWNSWEEDSFMLGWGILAACESLAEDSFKPPNTWNDSFWHCMHFAKGCVEPMAARRNLEMRDMAGNTNQPMVAIEDTPWLHAVWGPLRYKLANKHLERQRQKGPIPAAWRPRQSLVTNSNDQGEKGAKNSNFLTSRCCMSGSSFIFWRLQPHLQLCSCVRGQVYMYIYIKSQCNFVIDLSWLAS